MADNPFRAIPSVSELSASLDGSPSLHGSLLTEFFQAFLEEQRAAIRGGKQLTREELIESARTALDTFSRPRLEPVINATGVVIHTNLGRAPVSSETADAMRDAARGYVSLELDPESNVRGGRMDEISGLMRLLTGAESTLIVNNNAAAITLVLSTIAGGRSAIVSRGEAVEIGGGFRIPDVMRQSGAKLVEVGTTNRTYLRDYESAVDENTALFLKVHASNFTIEGFTASTGIAELSELSRRTGVPIVEDLGSGTLLDTSAFELAKEPTIGESIAAGAHVVTASGDKLLGGPQAGIIAGRAELVKQIERHPLARAVRADKTALAGIAATLRHYTRGEAAEKVPVWQMISAKVETLRTRATSLQMSLQGVGIAVDVVETSSTIGGGSLPGQRQPSIALALGSHGRPVDALAKALRTGTPRVFGRIESDRLLLDLRTVLPEQDDRLILALLTVFGADESRSA